ncbi:MAG: motif [Chloroflexia bacterium]|nr:motif [Chloroflexia bacterium]
MEYRLTRLNLLEACSWAAKLEFPDALDVIGIATEPFPFEQSSQVIIYFDVSYWPEDLREDSERVRDDLRLLRQLDKVEGIVHEYHDASALSASAEYPDDRIISVDLEPDEELEAFPRVAPKYTVERPGPNPRNKPCPCGSGRKYKKCCRR